MFQAGSALLYGVLSLISLSAVGTCAAATASLQNVRYQEAGGYTRVFIDLDAEARYESERIGDPDRVYFDISNSRLGDDFRKSNVAVRNELLERIRVAENRPGVVRVVLNIAGTADYRVSELHSPFRIVVDVYGASGSEPALNSSPSLIVPDSPVLAAARGSAAALKRSVAESGKSLTKAAPQPSHLTKAAAVSGSVFVSAISTAELPPSADAPVPGAPGVENALAEGQPSEAAELAVITPANPPKANLRRISDETELGVDLPLSITGTLSTGYYSSFTRGGGDEDRKISFVPAGAVIDVNGYYLTPDLLDYTIRTEANAGSQASDAGIEGGNGASVNITALRRGSVPTTFRYSNMQLKDAYFGSLSQVSSYTLKNRNKDLGLTTGLRVAGLPTATLDWGTSSVESESYNALIPNYTSHSNHVNVNCSDNRFGWDFQCFAERLQQTSDLFNPLGGDSSSSILRQQVTQFRGSARRGFLTDSELFIEGGNQFTSNTVFDQPINLTTRYASVNLRMFQRRRWKASMRAGYTSNISSLLLTQFVGGLTGNGTVAPDSSILQPFQRKTSYLNLNGLTSVDLSHGFSLYGKLDRTSVLAASESNLSSRYLTTAGGITFSKTYRWGSLSGQYGRSFGIGSITGQTGRISGQEYFISVQPGNPDGLQFDLSVRGSDQSVRNEMPAQESSFSSDAGVGFPLFGRLRFRLGGGIQKGNFSNQGSDFHTRGYTARIGIDHPRFQLSGSLNSNVGNSLQTFGGISGGIGLDSAFLTPLHIVPSDLRGVTVTLRLIPIRKLELSGLYTRSIQHLEGFVANDFEVVDVRATYHFRQLSIVAGYFNSIQIYSSYLAIYPQTERGRFYIRISRPIRLL
jgi:hypothetical protein